MAVFCNECGRQLNDGAKFCPGCGTAVGFVQAAAQTPISAPAPTMVPNYVPQPVAYGVPAQNPAPWIIAGVAVALLFAAGGYWLWSDRAAKQNAAVGSVSVAETVGPEVIKYVISDANIRNIATAKGAETRVVGSVRRGIQVKGNMYSGLSGDSYWFKLSDGRGYISAINLSDAAPTAVVPARATTVVTMGGTRAPVQSAPFCSVATNSGNLRIRVVPNGQIIGGMPKGARFQAFGSQTDATGATWYQVQPFETRYPNGWVSAAYIAC